MEDSSQIKLDSRSQMAETVKSVIMSAQHQVLIFSQKLETDLYSHREIYDYLIELITNNRNTEIKIIAHDTRAASHKGNYLIHLCQKLSSYASIRVTVTREHKNFRESWLIVDGRDYLRIRNLERYEGYYELNNKLECRNYREQFMDYWEACEPDQNTRRLSL